MRKQTILITVLSFVLLTILGCGTFKSPTTTPTLPTGTPPPTGTTAPPPLVTLGPPTATPAILPSATSADPGGKVIAPEYRDGVDLPAVAIYEIGYWPSQNKWLLGMHDNGLLSLPVGAESSTPEDWEILHRPDPLLAAVITRMAEMPDGRLAVGLLGVDEVSQSGVMLYDGTDWDYFAAPDAVRGAQDLYGVTVLSEDVLLVSFQSSLWQLDTAAGEWSAFEPMPECLGPYYDIKNTARGLFAAGPECGVWRLDQSWSQVIDGEGVYISHVELFNDTLYYTQDGEIWSLDGGSQERVYAHPGNLSWIRLFAASEQGFLFVSEPGLYFHDLAAQATAELLNWYEKTAYDFPHYGTSVLAAPLPQSVAWCDEPWTVGPKPSGFLGLPLVIDVALSPPVSFGTKAEGRPGGHPYRVHTSPESWRWGTWCGSRLYMTLDPIPGWKRPPGWFECHKPPGWKSNGEMASIVVPIYAEPPELYIENVSPGTGPLNQGTDIVVHAFGRDDHRMLQPNWGPGWSRMEIRYAMNSATDGTESGDWWRFATLSGSARPGGGVNALGEDVGENPVRGGGALSWQAAPGWMPQLGRHLIVVNLVALDDAGEAHWPAIWLDDVEERSVVVEWAPPTPTPTPVPVGRIEGVVFEDLNGDGVRDEGERGLGDIEVKVGNTARTVDEDGKYSLVLEAEREYTVRVTADDPDLPIGAELTTPGSKTVFISKDETVIVNFGFRRYGDIEGTVFADTDGDGIQDADEVGIPGLVVWMELTPMQTNEIGRYAFHWPAETGILGVTMDWPDFKLTTNNNPSTIAVRGGETIIVNFGFQQPEPQYIEPEIRLFMHLRGYELAHDLDKLHVDYLASEEVLYKLQIPAYIIPAAEIVAPPKFCSWITITQVCTSSITTEWTSYTFHGLERDGVWKEAEGGDFTANYLSSSHIFNPTPRPADDAYLWQDEYTHLYFNYPGSPTPTNCPDGQQCIHYENWAPGVQDLVFTMRGVGIWADEERWEFEMPVRLQLTTYTFSIEYRD